MTAVFDPEDGHIERVTVIEAGPCFVTGIRRAERGGYDTVQVAFGSVREKKLTKPKRWATSRRRSWPDEASGRVPRRGRRLEVGNELKLGTLFEKGQTVKVSGVSKGKGFAGTIKRHNFHRGPVSRLPQHPGAGIDRRLRRPGTGLQGDPRARANGQPARHAARPPGRGRAPRRQPAAGARLRSRGEGLRRGDPRGGLLMPTAAFIGSGGSGGLDLDDAVFSEPFHGQWCTRPFAPSWLHIAAGPPRPRRAPRWPMTGAKAWRQKGTGRARAGALSTPQRIGGGVAFGPKPAASR